VISLPGKQDFLNGQVFLAATMLNAIAADHEMSITAGHIVSEHATEEQLREAEDHLDNTLSLLDLNSGKLGKKIIESRSVAGGIARAGREYDLVVIGAAKEPFLRKVLFGEIPEKVAHYSPSAVMVVKKYEGAVKSILKRIFG